MLVHDFRIVAPNGFEIPGVEVDDEFTLEVRLRVFSLERERIDVSWLGADSDSLPGILSLKGVAVTPPTPAASPEPLAPDYWETAQ